MADWVEACRTGDVAEEDVRRFAYGSRTYAIYRAPGGAFYASEATCTHEAADLTEGFVIGMMIECPMHNGRFDIRTGEAKGAPACVDLKVFPVRVDGDRVLIDVAA